MQKQAKKKIPIHVVEIDGKKHFYRHYSPAKARDMALDDIVTARVATQDDIIEMVTKGHIIRGLPEDVDQDQDDLLTTEQRSAADAIDATNRAMAFGSIDSEANQGKTDRD